jgi:hypothetical protein
MLAPICKYDKWQSRCPAIPGLAHIDLAETKRETVPIDRPLPQNSATKWGGMV